MSKRQPDASATGLSSAKKRRLSALQQKHAGKKQSSTAVPDKQLLPQQATKSSAGYAPETKGKTTDNKDPIYRTILRSSLCDQLQKCLPRAGGYQEDEKDHAAAYLNCILAATSAAGTGAVAAQRNVRDRFLHLDNPAAVKKPEVKGRSQRRSRARARSEKDVPSKDAVKELQRIPADQQKSALYQPLRELWMQQAAKLLQHTSGRAAAPILMRDLAWQGADVVITECVNKNQVGQAGVLVQDRCNTLVVITGEDRQLVVAKRGTVLRMPLATGHVLLLRAEGMTASFM